MHTLAPTASRASMPTFARTPAQIRALRALAAGDVEAWRTTSIEDAFALLAAGLVEVLEVGGASLTAAGRAEITGDRGAFARALGAA